MYAPEVTPSVYEVRTARDLSLTALGFVTATVPYAFSKQWIHPSCPCDRDAVNAFDRGAIAHSSRSAELASDITLGASLALPPLLELKALGYGQAFQDEFVVYAQALSLNAALVSLTKVIVQRPLPRTYAGNDEHLVKTAAGYRSFYSGHSSMTVAALSAASFTYNLRHEGGHWPWLITAAVGTSVSIERVAAGRHFPTDVIVGSLVGAGIGIGVPWLHRRPRKKDDIAYNLIWMPNGLSLNATF